MLTEKSYSTICIYFSRLDMVRQIAERGRKENENWRFIRSSRGEIKFKLSEYC
jgi:hypothetical protein